MEAVDLHYQAFTKSVRSITGYRISHDMHDRFLNGLSTRQKIKWLCENGITHVDCIEEIFNLKQKLTLDLIPETIKPDPIKVSMMEQLASEYTLACVSNCVRASVDALLTQVDLFRFMAVTISNEDVNNPKPASDPYLKACSLLGMDRNDCMAIEDNRNGFLSANKAGIDCWMVEYDTVTYEHITNSIKGFNQSRLI